MRRALYTDKANGYKGCFKPNRFTRMKHSAAEALSPQKAGAFPQEWHPAFSRFLRHI